MSQFFCSVFLKNRDDVNRESMFIRFFGRIERLYGRALDYLLRQAIPRRLFQAGVIIIFFLSLGLVSNGLVKVEFLSRR